MTDTLPTIYHKKRPGIKEEAKETLHHLPTHTANYVKSLFPIAGWIGRYNLIWLAGDLIAGLTAGAVVIPQGMAYAKVAGLPPEYGLYSSFVGVSLYFLFATSKDITIGPTAVMSLLIGQSVAGILASPNHQFSAIELASSFALFSGIISLILGLLRLGLVVDFIPAPVIAGFTTGSAITISIGQIAKLMGIPKIVTTDPCYLVLGRTLAALPKTNYDAIFGFISLIYLYSVKYGSRYAAKRWPHHERLFFFIEILRNITIVIFATIVSFLVNIGKKTSPISILKTIPSGLHVGVPNAGSDMLSELGSKLISVTFILILEHVAIAKSFGRINNYKITESQEFIAIGVTNAIGSFFHAYPATGSFSRTAIKSKSGVRTPLAGVFSGILVIIALYSTAAFYYIPDATLSAVIIHAVLDLVASPHYIKQLWKIQFWDFMVFLVGVVVTFFTTVEYGIYFSALLAIVVLLLRVARPSFDSLGQLSITTKDGEKRHAYVPIDHPSFESASNPPEGVLIIRFRESLTYPNSNYIDTQVVEYARTNTKRFYKQVENKGDRPWNELPHKSEKEEEAKATKPRLNAVVFDLAAVSVIDSTGIQALSDIRKELNKHADQQVEYHFANIINERIEEILLLAGFGILIDNEIINEKVDEETSTDVTHISTKKFFHLTIDDAVAAATNTSF
ncbi:sulfate permease [Rhizophagus irregularis]|uniref:Sulfate permease n=1 Tax=Rhizophagus irregularis TaxID=588596 RepID=A0A2N0SB88_9GLOM|nr:sulfate permease [Rhizophagus irregularis]